MLRLNCFFQANEGKYDEALQAAIALTAASLKDEGNIAYDTFESATRPDVFMICETWQDQASLDLHAHAEHFTRLVPQIKALTVEGMKRDDFLF